MLEILKNVPGTAIVYCKSRKHTKEIAGLLHDEMKAFGETLKGKERQIFYERLMADDPRTLQELGTDFGVSRERVRQLEKRLQGRLKKYLEEKLGAELLES